MKFKASIMSGCKPAEIYMEEREDKRENGVGSSQLARQKPAEKNSLTFHWLHAPPHHCSTMKRHTRAVISGNLAAGEWAEPLALLL
jgi:hypothetical protein